VTAASAASGPGARWSDPPASLHDWQKVTGQVSFLSEWEFPGALHAAVVRSPHPRARVVAVDLLAAGRLPGVVAVHTHEELPDRLFNPAGEPPDEQLDQSADRRLLTDEAQHVGDGVAVVVATTRTGARRAAAALAVKWELRPDTQRVEDGCVAGEMAWGEPVDEAMAEADVVLDRTYRTQAVQHMCLEPHACAAVFEPGRGHLTIWTNSQTPSDVRRISSEILGLPMTALHVRKVNEGGGFGAKQEIYEEPLIAWLALHHRRPVQLAYDRAEEFTAGRCRHASRIRVRLGATREGRIVALSLEARLDSGAYASHAPFVLGNVMCAAYYTYPFARYFIRGEVARTNTLPGGAYRGYGTPQALFAVEQAVDELAATVGRDPVDVRLANSTGVAPHPLFGEAPRRLARLLALGRARAGWDGELTAHPDLCRGRGMAMATMLNTTGGDPYEHTTALLRLNEDGTLTLATGTVDCGTGSSAALAALAAGELGIDPRRVEVCEGDTTAALADLGSFSQRSIFVGGGAVLAAARRLRDLVVAETARQAEVPSDGLEIIDGHVRDGGHLDIPLAQVARMSASRGALLAVETYSPSGSPPSYAACFAEVSVDPGTGAVLVDRLTAAVDCGRVLNHAAAVGQVVGATAQGVGYALYEDLRPPGGPVPVVTLEEHGVCLAGDLPDIAVVFLDEPDHAGPHGAKGVGEVAIPPVAPAIANAVAAATGVRCLQLPLRPPAVWAALRAGDRP
jgi:xanthine dehydrogenase molybdenum-binding subunit